MKIETVETENIRAHTGHIHSSGTRKNESELVDTVDKKIKMCKNNLLHRHDADYFHFNRNVSRMANHKS